VGRHKNYPPVHHSSSFTIITHTFYESALISSSSREREMTHHNLQDLFQTCDTRRQGVIGPPEFRELCANFGISPADADTIFADLDHDRDGSIDFSDFSHGFRDFLTPGSRRGSLQLPPHLTDSLHQMQLRHQSAQNAWKHFSSSVGVTNLRPFIGDTYTTLTFT